MADTITHTWQTVEQAAVTLNVSTRTIARRIAGGTIESRVDDNGRRLVLVETFGAAAGDSGNTERQTPDVGYDMDENALAIASASAIARPVSSDDGFNPAATSVLAVLQSTIDAARTDAARARTGARWAWAGVGVMVVVIGVGGMVLVNRLTRAQTQAEMLQGDVVAVKNDLERSRNDLVIVSSAKAVADQKREAAEQQFAAADAKRRENENQLAFARQQVIEAQRAVAVTNAAAEKRPSSTQPASLLSRLVTLPIEPDPR